MNKKKRCRNNDNDAENGFAVWGGYMEAKKSKLIQQYHESTETEQIQQISNIFNGIQLMVNGLTNPNADEIKKLMQQHGGVYQIYQNSSTTHIIASNLPNIKINKLGTVPIVKPSWIIDSIDLGKLQDYRRYLLYTNQTITQPRLNFPIIGPQRCKTASDPNFVEEFYQNSRLHLIATLGTEYKQLITKKRQEPPGNYPKLQQLIDNNNNNNNNESYQYPIIMHIDMDCFFVSVGIRNRPELQHQPVAVTHARNPQNNNNNNNSNLDRGLMHNELIDNKSSLSEIASCNYIARQFGVRNGMFLGAAIKLCPNLITIPYNFDDYRQVSRILYETLLDYTLDIEAVSCDEMYVDCSGILQQTKLTIEQWSAHIRDEIYTKTRCCCSTGFGQNRLQARLATKQAKPSNWYWIRSDSVADYMKTIQISDLPGVGDATITKLTKFNIKTCGDLLEKITNKTITLDQLKLELGRKFGEQIYQQSQGLDVQQLNYNYERKSISCDINYGIRFQQLDECFVFLQNLTKETCQRLNDCKMLTKCIQLKLLVRAKEAPVQTAKYLGHGVCDLINKTIKLNRAVNDPRIIYKHIKCLYEKINPILADLRGIGIHLTKLEKHQQPNNNLKRLFDKMPDNCWNISNNPAETTTIDKFFKATRAIKKHDDKIDYQVLNELPDDIRDEIIKEYQLPPAYISNNSGDKSDKGGVSPFFGLQLSELRAMLYDWFRTELIPKQYDIDMLIDYCQQLIQHQYDIEYLFVILRFLYRNLLKLNCDWHRAYHGIYNQIQDTVVLVYGHRLKVGHQFPCCSTK